MSAHSISRPVVVALDDHDEPDAAEALRLEILTETGVELSSREVSHIVRGMEARTFPIARSMPLPLTVQPWLRAVDERMNDARRGGVRA